MDVGNGVADLNGRRVLVGVSVCVGLGVRVGTTSSIDVRNTRGIYNLNSSWNTAGCRVCSGPKREIMRKITYRQPVIDRYMMSSQLEFPAEEYDYLTSS